MVFSKEELLNKLQPLIKQKVQDAAAELNNDLEDLVEYEFAQETAAGAPYIKGFEYLENWIFPRVEIKETDNGATMSVNLAPQHSLHPGLDTLLGMVAQNVMAKLKYNRRS